MNIITLKIKVEQPPTEWLLFYNHFYNHKVNNHTFESFAIPGKTLATKV